jgi:hypothetical protein
MSKNKVEGDEMGMKFMKQGNCNFNFQTKWQGFEGVHELREPLKLREPLEVRDAHDEHSNGL